jgi:hypothetical protein
MEHFLCFGKYWSFLDTVFGKLFKNFVCKTPVFAEQYRGKNDVGNSWRFKTIVFQPGVEEPLWLCIA